MGYTVEHLETSRAEGFQPLPVLRAVLGELLGFAEAPAALLDCGCGTGFFTRQYARLPGISATGLDMDETLLAAARDIAAAEGLDISFVQGDITCLPFPDGEEITPARRELAPKLNPDYDHTIKYQPRTQRPEWAAVGLLGKLVAVDDGTCQVNGWATVGKGGKAIASAARTKYRVMARLDAAHVKLMIL